MNLRFAVLALVPVFSLSCVIHAQLPPRVERCLPYPTLAQEISAIQDETRTQALEAVPTPKVVIASIQFVPTTHVSEPVRNRIISSIKSPQFLDDSDKEWLQEIQDVGVRGTLQDSGYFKAKVKADARFLNGNDRRRRYALTLRIEEGRQYRLGDVRFERADLDKPPLAFSASELRQTYI